jgi:dTDP-glucose 4,6-dehydratase
LLESDVDTPVNIGNPDERSILELAELIIDITYSDSEITYEPLPPQDPDIRRPDISKVRTEVGWEPTVELRDGLERSVPYFDERAGGE